VRLRDESLEDSDNRPDPDVQRAGGGRCFLAGQTSGQIFETSEVEIPTWRAASAIGGQNRNGPDRRAGKSHSPIQTPILNCFGDVGGLEFLGAGEVSDCAAHFKHATAAWRLRPSLLLAASNSLVRSLGSDITIITILFSAIRY